MFADEWREDEGRKAKERQGSRTDIVETLPPSDTGKARDKIGEKVGVSEAKTHSLVT